MKKILLITLFLTVGFSQNQVNANNLLPVGGKIFKENERKPFDGIVFDLSKESGNIILEFRMVNGLMNGLYQEWYPDGKLKRKGKYLNNTQVGDWTVWYENGQMKLELTYKMKITLFNSIFFKIGFGILAKSENSVTRCSMLLICFAIVFK